MKASVKTATPEGIVIRNATSSDGAAIEKIYQESFPLEDLLPLVSELQKDPALALNIVAARGNAIAGHVAWTPCALDGAEEKVVLLGPLAVSEHERRKGIATALIRQGLDRMKRDGFAAVCVLGDPAYYARYGFEKETHIGPPYALPPRYAGAWQSIVFDSNTPHAGRLVPPSLWMHPQLWGP